MERKEDGISDDEVDLFDKWSETIEEHGLSWEEYKKRAESVAEQKNKKEKIQITEQIIDSIPKVKLPGWSDDWAEQVQKIHQDILRYSMDNNDCNEVGVVMSNGKISQFVKGTDDMLDFSSLRIGSYQNVFHNHPRGSSYSMLDIRFFVDNTGLQLLSIIKNDGSTELLEKAEKYNQRRAKILVNRAIKKIANNPASPTDSEYCKIVIKILNNFQKEGYIVWAKSDLKL